jgi:hypothetical protein
MEKITNQGLPIVSAKTIDAVFHVYAGKKWDKLLNQVRDTLIKNNPHLRRFIESQVSKYPRELHSGIFEVVLGTIAVLEHQKLADAKQIERQQSRENR